ncbi:enoyl-CoA hydratase-related protein [Tepidibacillus marianensis]|uniref:enoyl-CoA hydratase-related protein n=1 Tax=Tepidibacillus marianensis TaxID=3131995 RepID=UPI0030D517B1
MEFERLNYELEDRIAVITINHPPVNTLGIKTLQELETAIEAVSVDSRVKAVVLTGQGMAFIAGADIKEIAAVSSQEEGERLARTGQQLFDQIEMMKKPVIAAVNGVCLGGGMELAMACHIRIAGKQAKFGQPEINLGIIPGFGGTQRLTRLTNRSIALEWILTGNLYSAEEAYHVGVVNRVVPHESVLEEAKMLAHQISSKGGVAIAKSIEAVDQGLVGTLDDGLKNEAKLFGELCITEDKKEGTQAFLQKRPPVFEDK